MIATGQRFLQGVDQITKYRNSLKETMNQLEAQWGGNAATAFAKAMTDWDTQYNIIIEQLREIAGLLGVGGKGVDATEQNNIGTAAFFKGM